MRDRRLLTLVAGTLAVRAAVAAAVPLLTVEAYYWLWNRHLAAGYVDHPPMTAFVSWICFGAFPGVELAARAGALATGAATILAVYGLAKEMFPGSGVAWRAALLFSITPIFAGLGAVVEPDNPLVLFVILTWWMFWRALQRGGVGWWAAAGATAGCALLSKFHAWVLLPPLFLFPLLAPRRRAVFATPGPWIALAVALAVVAPNLVWNARHDWVNYKFQMHRSAYSDAEGPSIYVHVFLGGAVLALSPALAWTLAATVGRGVKRARGDDRVLYLLCAGVPLPAFLGLLSVTSKISVHWPSAGYAALIVLAAHFAEPGADGRAVAPISRWAWGGAAAFTTVLFAAPLVVFSCPLMPRPADHGLAALSPGGVQRDAAGWREIGAAVREEHAKLEAEGTSVVFAEKWTSAAMLAFYSGLVDDCFALEAKWAVSFEVWRKERGGLRGASALFVTEPSRKKPSGDPEETSATRARLLALFDSAERLPSLVLYDDGGKERAEKADPSRPLLKEFEIWRCRGFHGGLETE